MAINYTSDILSLYDGKVANESAYQAPGLYNIPAGYAGDSVASIAVTNPGSGFTSVPTVTFSGGSPETAATVDAVNMRAVNASAVARGDGYDVGETVTLTGGTSSEAAILAITSVILESLEVNAGGTGYAVNDTITLAGGTASASAVVTVDTVNAGVITGITISTPGEFTVSSETFTQAGTSGNGTGATFDTATFAVGAVTVSATDGVYTALPSSPVSQGSTSGTGTGATFNVSWGINAVTVDEAGAGYSTLPSVVVSGGGGSNAVLTAVLEASTNEAELLTLVEVIRAYFANLGSAHEAKLAQGVLHRMLSRLPTGGASTTFSGSNVAARARETAMRYYAGMKRNPDL